MRLSWGSDSIQFRKKQHKLPPLFKCVVCQHRPSDTMHHHIPICKSCKATLDKHIKYDGGLIIQNLDELRKANSPSDISALSESIIKHASKLVSYEDLRIKTIEPTPTSIIHRVRIQEYNDLSPELFFENDVTTGSPKHKRPLRHALFFGAVIVIIVVVVAIVGLWQKGGFRPSSSGSTSKEIKVTQPLEAVSSHWRVVIMHTLLKQGPYYNILFYYRGSTPMSSIGSVTAKWRGGTGTSEINGQPIQPGAQVGDFDDTSLPHGFSDTPPVRVNWTEHGKRYTETLRLSNAQSSLKITNHHVYKGGDAHWKVSYEYETIKGKGFGHSYAVFVVNHNGQPIGNVDCGVNSSSGAQSFNLQSSDINTMRFDANLLQQPGFDITGGQAKMTIAWSTGTDVIALHKSH